MAVRVTLTNKSQQTKSLAEKTSTNSLHMSRTVYQQLRSLAKNKHISDSYNNGLLPEEFVSMLDEFNKLSSGESVGEDTQELNKYLGELGIAEIYPFTKDMISIPEWVTPNSQDVARNVITSQTGTDYNVVTDIGGTIYNVVHET